MLLTTALTKIIIIVSLAIAMSSLVVLVFPSEEQQQEAVGDKIIIIQTGRIQRHRQPQLNQ